MALRAFVQELKIVTERKSDGGLTSVGALAM